MSTLVTGPPGASKAYKGMKSHLNWTWLHGKKKAVRDAGKGLLVAFVTALTLILLIAVVGVWTSAASVGATVRRKLRSVKEPSDLFVISGT
ncbi:MAG TPA: hypothetical protein VMG82_06810 [Candidatus Sulfotelmatobacter sp.]|nr:hypothetical protein [Candidatus Sulfotelmatobacter sp.]